MYVCAVDSPLPCCSSYWLFSSEFKGSAIHHRSGYHYPHEHRRMLFEIRYLFVLSAEEKVCATLTSTASQRCSLSCRCHSTDEFANEHQNILAWSALRKTPICSSTPRFAKETSGPVMIRSLDTFLVLFRQIFLINEARPAHSRLRSVTWRGNQVTGKPCRDIDLNKYSNSSCAVCLVLSAAHLDNICARYLAKAATST